MKNLRWNNFGIGLVLLVLLMTVSGCGRWWVNTDYYYPVWKDANTIYCVEGEHKERYMLGVPIKINDDCAYYLASMDTEGNNYQRILLLSDKDAGTISLSGDLLVYSKDWNVSNNTSEIWSMELDGGNNKKIVSGDFPRLSPDGTKVAYQSSDDAIWIIGIDGTGAKKIWDTSRNFSCAWSSDSVKVAIPTGEGIRIVSISTLESNLIPVEYMDYIDWSPDGNEFVYWNPGLMIVDVNGTSTTKIYGEIFDSPMWSPDSQKIIGEDGGIAIINRDGTNYKVIKENVEF